MGCRLDIIGHKYGKLTVLSESDVRKNGERHYLCGCECGKTKIVRRGSLRSGKTTTCGGRDCRNYNTDAAHKAATKHGMCDTRLYRIWAGIKNRCKYDPHYAGRGIRMYEEWHDSPEIFIEWALLNGYNDKLSIDRIDTLGDYLPDNCRWVTCKTQARNTINNRLLSYAGKTMCVSAWGEYLGIHKATLQYRLNAGWSVERTLTERVQRRER